MGYAHGDDQKVGGSSKTTWEAVSEWREWSKGQMEMRNDELIVYMYVEQE